MSFIESIEIGRLYSVHERCDGLDEAEKVNRCYREIEDIFLNLVKFYPNSNEYTIMTFGDPNTFHIAIGGDVALFEKADTACSWLVRFFKNIHIELTVLRKGEL